MMVPINKYHTGFGRKRIADRSEGRRIAEAVRVEYERQKEEIVSDYWLRVLAAAGLAFYDLTGSKSKTEKCLTKLAERLEVAKDNDVPTSEIVKELEGRTGIELEVRDV